MATAIREYKKRSFVHEYFERVGADAPVCKLCKTQLKTPAGNTSNLRSHLSVKHRDTYDEMTTKEATMAQQKKLKTVHYGQMSLNDFAMTAKWDDKHPRAKAATMCLARMVCADLQPYSIVRDPGFVEFVKSLEPRYKLPTRSALSNEIVPSLYEKVRREVADSVVNNCVLSLAITTDGWTSVTNDSYISFTAHYLDESFHVHNDCLRVQYFTDSHTADHLALATEDCIKLWLLEYMQKKVQIFVITDNAANIKAALRQLPMFHHLTCFGHSLQLTILHAVKEFSGLKILSAKARKIVSHFHHSSQASHRLQVAQTQLKLPLHKLKMEVATRWNSTVHMMTRLVEQKDAVSLVLASTESETVSNLTPFEWRTAADYCKTLQPFEEATSLMSGSRYPTLSMIIPVLNILHKKIRDSADGLVDFKQALAKGLYDRWPQYENVPLFAAASLVDPRFKRFAFSSEHTFRAAFMDVAQKMETKLTEQEASQSTSMQSQENSAPDGVDVEQQTASQSPASSSLWSTFTDMIAEQLATASSSTSCKERAEHELQSYLNSPVVEPEKCAFDWWSSNAACFPLVAVVARTLLAVPATSVPSEQLFSTAGQIVTERRNRLKPEHVEQLVFLSKNIRK